MDLWLSPAVHRDPMFSIFLALSGCRPDGPQVVIFPTNPTTLDALAASPTPAEGQRWSWRWLRDGIWIEDLHGPRVPADQTRRGEIWALEVQQLEPERSRITETSVQIGNAPPLVEVHLRRSATVRDAPLEAEVEASDPDGDPLELSYAWSRGGLGIEGGATIGADQLSLGQRWQVTVTANDGVDSSSATASMVIGNHPPAVVSLELQPAVFGETDEVRAVVEATDPDGEEPKIEVTWFVEGQSVHEGPTLTGASFDRGDEVYARAVATDGMESSPPVASAISVVANTPPQTVQIELSPPAPSTLDEVTVEVALSDPDGDLSTFNVIWYADGAEIERGHRLAPGLVQRGQQLMAEVIATDGLSFGPPVQSAVLTVADAPPTIPPVSLQPSNAHADEPLRCHLGADVAGADVVDADGDLVEVAIQWTVDGAPYTGPLVRHRIDGDTIPAGQLGFGQSWGCSVDAITELASSRALSEPLVVPDPPGGNVLLVILDDVGVDKMPSFGAYPNQPDLPTLDRIAASGIAFTNTWAHPVCSPSRAALFTGRLPHRTGMGATSDSKDNHYDLPPAEVTLPEALRLSPLGYTSALLGKWHLNDTQDTSWPSLVLEQGWDHFAGTASNLGLHHLPGPTPAELGLTGDTGQELPSFGYYLFEKYDDGALGWETTYATTDTVDDGIELLSTLPEPWLITVSLHAAHIPMDEPPAALHHQGPLDNAPGWV
ncbi:MAG TPA: hypothetical protein ENK18_01095, partial [Deltaproteobacteria bacterium]|nr:hypothetical protein [Deltaproteobacteria bacterium]